MNREEYIKLRYENLLGEVAYYYFIENSNSKLRKDEFRFFFINFANNPIIQETLQIDWNRLWDYYDSKFNLNILFDINKKIIKIF